MQYGLGIDLGTTKTAAAVRVEGRVEVVRLGGRRAEIPSLVFVKTDGSLLIGEAAERRGQAEPARLAREFKRRMGDPVPILVGGTPFSAHALTGKLLRHVLDTVGQLQDGPPAAITVTHPANWGPYKREQLDQAIRLADAGPVQLRSEPEAAALQHATARRIAPGETVAVYDLGGGTFDVAVLRRDGDGFVLLGEPEGIEQLGGIDFDEAVFGHVLGVLGSMADGMDPTDPEAVAALSRLRRDCVEAKEALSFDTETMIPVALPGLHTRVRLNRSELESMIAPSLADTVTATQRALRTAGVTPGQLSAILLAGGSSRIPLVSQLLSTEFQRPVVADPHPEHSIAMGAAVATAGVLGGGSPFSSAVPQPRPGGGPHPTLVDMPADGGYSPVASPVASPQRRGAAAGATAAGAAASAANGGAGGQYGGNAPVSGGAPGYGGAGAGAAGYGGDPTQPYGGNAPVNGGSPGYGAATPAGGAGTPGYGGNAPVSGGAPGYGAATPASRAGAPGYGGNAPVSGGAPGYGAASPAGGAGAPGYGGNAPVSGGAPGYGTTASTGGAGAGAPAYGQDTTAQQYGGGNAAAYGANASASTATPSYGADAPSYGSNAPASGAGAPPYGGTNAPAGSAGPNAAYGAGTSAPPYGGNAPASGAGVGAPAYGGGAQAGNVAFSRGAASVPGAAPGTSGGGAPGVPGEGGTNIPWPPPPLPAPPGGEKRNVAKIAGIAALAVALLAGGTTAALVLMNHKDDPGTQAQPITPTTAAATSAVADPNALPTNKILVRVDTGGPNPPERKSKIYYFTPGQPERTPLPGSVFGDVLPKWSHHRDQIALTHNSPDNKTSSIFIMNADGGDRRELVKDGGGRVAWSADDTKIAFMRELNKINQIFVVTVASGEVKQLTHSTTPKDDAMWSPDGRTILYYRTEKGINNIYELTVADPQEPGRPITGPEQGPANDPVYSPDGQKVLYTREIDGNKTSDIWMVDIDGRNAHPVTSNPAREMDPTWSPDGKWFAFVRGDYDKPTVVVQRTAGGGEQVLTPAGAREGHPCWF